MPEHSGLLIYGRGEIKLKLLPYLCSIVVVKYIKYGDESLQTAVCDFGRNRIRVIILGTVVGQVNRHQAMLQN